MENKEYFKGLKYEGYYDEKGNFCIDIDEENVKELIKKITGAKEVNITRR